MKPLNLRKNILSIFSFVIVSGYCFAQQGNVVINQDKNITTLIEVKKEMNKNVNTSEKYKIQIYSGNRSSAEAAQKEFNNSFTEWKASLEYETPNFKIWVGSYRTRLEAEKALKKIKSKFPVAFVFRPKK